MEGGEKGCYDNTIMNLTHAENNKRANNGTIGLSGKRITAPQKLIFELTWMFSFHHTSKDIL